MSVVAGYDLANLHDADAMEALLRRIGAEHRWNHIEKLYEFDGEPAFTKAQGED